MAPKDLRALRDGHRGLALVLYLDLPEDDVEESLQSLPEVLALDREAVGPILDFLRTSVESGSATALTDSAASALSLMLATGVEWQAFLAPMLEGIAGKPMDELALARR